jgi:hypothetical protein
LIANSPIAQQALLATDTASFTHCGFSCFAATLRNS